MIAVARFVRDRRRTVARTLRETFGVGLSDLGDGLSWGEAALLLEEAASDPSTHLGAEMAEWAYPATTLQLLTLIAQVGKESVSRRLMPWSPELATRSAATPSEVAAATAELEAGIVFS